MFPRGNTYAKWKFIRKKIDADENSVGRSNYNPIIYMREYCVEFDDDEVIELMVNSFAESMYAACDDSGH